MKQIPEVGYQIASNLEGRSTLLQALFDKFQKLNYIGFNNCITKSKEQLFIRRPQKRNYIIIRNFVPGERNQLIQERKRIAHGTFSDASNQVQSLFIDGKAFFPGYLH